MPRQVDHEQRRREVTQAAAALVAERGRQALTVRNVAEAVGYSTTVVSHYFDDMAELLHETYALAAARSRVRIDAVMAADPLDIIGIAEAVLPLDADRRADWRIWLAFWSEALASPELTADQRRRARGTTERFANCLRHLAEQGRISGDVDIHDAAGRLGALVAGIAAQAMFDPRGWPAARQRAVFAGELSLIGLRELPHSVATTNG